MSSSHNHGTRYSSANVKAGTIDADLAALTARVAKLEAAQPPVVTPPTPPTSGIPAIPAGAGTLFKHNFATDGMGLFRQLTYPNGHEADQDPMLGWFTGKVGKRYLVQKYVTDAVHTSIHDGYLDQQVTLDGPTQTWLASFVGTFDITTNAFTKSFTPPFYVRYCIDLGGAATKADWRTAWVYGTWLNHDLEVPDFPEIIGRQVTANLHPGSVRIATEAIPAGWAIFGVRVTASAVSVDIGGTLVGQGALAVGTGPLGLFLDAKVGLDYPDATTGSPRLKTAWITVDP